MLNTTARTFGFKKLLDLKLHPLPTLLHMSRQRDSYVILLGTYYIPCPQMSTLKNFRGRIFTPKTWSTTRNVYYAKLIRSVCQWADVDFLVVLMSLYIWLS